MIEMRGAPSASRSGRVLTWLQITLPALGSACLFFLTSFYLFLPAFQENLMAQKRQMLRRQTDIALGVLEHFHEQETNGELSREEAQQAAVNTIRGIRFGPEGLDYFWINDMDVRMVMHPYRPDLNGTDVSDFADPQGKRLFVECVGVVEARGEGYVDYIWQRQDDPDHLVPKVSFVKGFEPWRWVVGTGVYFEDVREETAAITHWLVNASILITLVILMLSSYLAFLAMRGEKKRKKTEDELRESERLLASILEFLPDATMVVDANRKVIAWNRAMAELSGIPAKDILGTSERSYAKPFYGETRPILLDMVFDDGTVPEDLENEYQFIHREQGLFVAETYTPIMQLHVVASAGPLKDAEGRIIGAIETIVDITPRKKAEAEQKKLRAQLHRSQRLESIGKLAGSIAHDFNNLLTPILGYAELMMLKENLDDEQNENLRLISEAAQRAQDLIRQLLALSRRRSMESTVLNLNHVIDSFLGILKGTLRDDIDLTLSLGKALAPIHADVAHLEQVLMNLVVNAQDAMPKGGKLAIETSNILLDSTFAGAHPDAAPGDYVLLTVSDTGDGMDKETQAKIFEPFFTTKAEEKGTGLGLATVRGIIEQHQGHIWVYSEVGLGTTFKILLPVATEELTQVPTTSRENDVAPGSETILVVEDDPMILDFVKNLLTLHGYTILTAGMPDEGIRLAREHEGTIDLLLSDVIMPKMNGPELYEKISELHPGIPVLFISGYTGEVMEHHGILEDAANFIHKPFSLTVLSAKLREILDHRS